MFIRKILFGIYTRIVSLLTALFGIPFLFFWALGSRYARKKIDIGLGSEPLINNVYHKRALTKFGYSAETFVASVYYITQEFDIRADRFLNALPAWDPIQYLGNARLLIINAIAWTLNTA